MQGAGRAGVLLYFKCLADAVPRDRLLFFRAPFHNQPVAEFGSFAGLEALGGHPPRAARVAPARRAAFTTAHGMVDRVHGHPANAGPAPQPTLAAGFADRDVFVFGIAELADGGLAIQ